mgnify:CR=1 FL=1
MTSFEQASNGPGPRLMGADTLMGNDVYNRQDEDLGDIKEIMLDVAGGRISYAVLSYGGLLGMGERARRLSGSITVTSSPGQGTTVAVDIPLTTTPAPVSAAPELRSVPLS